MLRQKVDISMNAFSILFEDVSVGMGTLETSLHLVDTYVQEIIVIHAGHTKRKTYLAIINFGISFIIDILCCFHRPHKR